MVMTIHHGFRCQNSPVVAWDAGDAGQVDQQLSFMAQCLGGLRALRVAVGGGRAVPW